MALTFGEDGALAALYGECYTAHFGEYKYTICPFEKATQNSDSLGKPVAAAPPVSRH